MGRARTTLVVLLMLAGSPAAAAPGDRPGEAVDPPAAAAPAADGEQAVPASGPARETLDRLLESPSWARRAIAAVRLERYDDEVSAEMLRALLRDEVWQVRAFATRTLGRRRVGGDEGWFTDEHEPHVIRAALRHRYPLDVERVGRGVNYLVRRESLDDKMLGAELAFGSGDEALGTLAEETLKTIIIRMDRRQAGVLSPRLTALTGRDYQRRTDWQRWLRRAGRPLPVGGGWAVPEDPRERPTPSFIARLDEERFFSLEDYITRLAERRVDLAICLDTTASMYGELAEAQGELDDMMTFAADVVAELRVGVVAYRDRKDQYETTGWDLTSDIDAARARLWQLSAGGGGDTPEAVLPALHRAYARMSWAPQHTKVLILVGDAPPHPGFGSRCATLAEIAYDHMGLVTHAIQVGEKPVKHFPRIAEAGGGRCLDLEHGDSLVAEVAGLTLGERFADELREFFRIYLELCR